MSYAHYHLLLKVENSTKVYGFEVDVVVGKECVAKPYHICAFSLCGI